MRVKYEAINAQGVMVADSLVAETVAQAQAELKRRGLTPVRLQQGGGKSSARPAWLDKLTSPTKMASAHKASRRHLPFFTAQMSILLETGTTVAASLEALEEQISCVHWRELIRDMHRRVAEGGALAAAIASHPQIFDPIYVSMVCAGESSGTLDSIFRRLADLASQTDRIRGKVIGAMIYPALLTTIAIGVLVVLIFFVLPRFEELFIEMKVDLPGSTKAFLALSHIVRDNLVLTLASVGAVITAVVLYLRSSMGQRFINVALVKMPLVSPLYISVVNARIFRLIGLLAEANVSLVETLELASKASKNHLFRSLIENVRENVINGGNMYEVLRQSRLIPPSVAEMMHTAEQNGQIDRVMGMLSDYMDDKNETKVSTLTTIMEPIILVLMGIVIGIVAMSLVLPMFDLSKVAGA